MKQSKAKIYKTYFTYSAPVSEKSKKAIKDAVIELRDKVKKNKQLFDNLHINVCYGASDLQGETPLDNSVRRSPYNYDQTTLGTTQIPVLNNDKREIVVRSGNIFSWTPWKSSYSASKLKNTLLHEIGHRFDLDLTKDKKAEEELRRIENIEKLGSLVIKLQSAQLSNSKEFKQAWKEDIESWSDKRWTLLNLNYFRPDSFSNINIWDGIDDKEIEQAYKEREEIFAQLFAYVVGAENDEEKDDLIKKSYAKAFEVVKSFVNKYLGIETSE